MNWYRLRYWVENFTPENCEEEDSAFCDNKVMGWNYGIFYCWSVLMKKEMRVIWQREYLILFSAIFGCSRLWFRSHSVEGSFWGAKSGEFTCQHKSFRFFTQSPGLLFLHEADILNNFTWFIVLVLYIFFLMCFTLYWTFNSIWYWWYV